MMNLLNIIPLTALPLLDTSSARALSADNQFTQLNTVLSSIVLDLPDASISKSGLDVDITQLSCTNLNINDLSIDHSEESSTLQRIQIDASGSVIECSFRYEYKWSFFSGSGSGTGLMDPSSTASIDLDFLSQDYNSQPPSSVDLSRCATDVQIADLTLDGDGLGIVSSVMNAMESSFRGTIENELNGVICDELRGWGEDMFEGLLSKMSTSVQGYLEPVTSDALALTATNKEYVNLQAVASRIEDLTGQSTSQLIDSFLSSDDRFDVNKFVDKLLPNGKVSIDLSSLMDNKLEVKIDELLANTTLSMTSVRVGGLDAISSLEVFNLIGAHTFENSFELNQLDVEIDMVLEMQAQSEGMIRETFTMELDMNDVKVNFATFLGINKSTLGDLQLGNLLHTEDILPCLLSTIDYVELATLNISVDSLSSPILVGFDDLGLEYVAVQSITALYEMYEIILFQAIPNFASSLGRKALSDYVHGLVMDNSECDKNEVEGDGLVDFRDLLLPAEDARELKASGNEQYGNLFSQIYSFVEPIVSTVNEDGFSLVNAMISSVIDLEDGNIILGDLFHQQFSVSLNGLNADVELGMSDVKISNVDSIGQFYLLQPMVNEMSTLNNTASIGVNEALRMSATLLVKGKGDKVEVDNEVTLGISLEEVDVAAHIMAQIQETSFFNFPLREITNLDCWLATIVPPVLDKYGVREVEAESGLLLRKLAMAAAEAEFDMECISCSSPMLLDMDAYFSSNEGVADTTSVANMLFNYASNLLEGEMIQSQLDRMINDASAKCPHSSSYQQNFAAVKYEEFAPLEQEEQSLNFLFAIAGVVGTTLIVVFVVYSIAKCISLRRHRRWLKTLNSEQKAELENMQIRGKRQQRDLDKRVNALICSKEVPLIWRLSIPLIIFGNIVLFLSGHLSLGGTVNISGSFAGEDFEVEGFYDFSVLSSTIEMWEAGAHALAILIAIFSVIWPYTKQLITLALWICPTSLAGARRRGAILQWLDVLGKWSMVDIFVLLLTLASFNLSVSSPSLKFLPDGLYDIRLMVVPMWGLYSNMIAQLVSQVSSHIIIAYHKKSVRSATKAQEVEWGVSQAKNESAEQLFRHNYSLDYEASSKRATVRKGINWVVSILLFALVGLVIIGCVLPSFNIELFGLVGLAVESGKQFEEAATDYSVFGLAKMIMTQARYLTSATDFIGLGTLASLLVITVFIVPLAQAASLFISWFIPLTNKARARNEVLNEILGAWQYMEVYVLSIVITAWQISGVSEFMINAYCGSLRNAFASLAFYGILDAEDAQCFTVHATVETASWLLVTASVVLFVLGKFIGGAVRQKKQDDMTPIGKRFHSDRWVGDQSVTTDEEEGSSSDSRGEVSLGKSRVSPVPPRFTDFFAFALIKSSELDIPAFDDDVETAVVSKEGEV